MGLIETLENALLLIQRYENGDLNGEDLVVEYVDILASLIYNLREVPLPLSKLSMDKDKVNYKKVKDLIEKTLEELKYSSETERKGFTKKVDNYYINNGLTVKLVMIKDILESTPYKNLWVLKNMLLKSAGDIPVYLKYKGLSDMKYYNENVLNELYEYLLNLPDDLQNLSDKTIKAIVSVTIAKIDDVLKSKFKKGA